MEKVSKGRALLCVTCNGQSLRSAPCLLMSPCHICHTAWGFTGRQRAGFPTDLGNPSTSLCQNIVFLFKWKFVGKKAFSVSKILPNQCHQHHSTSMPLREAACPSLGQGCRKTQQAGICCLSVPCPCCKLPACHARVLHTFHCSPLALLSASWAAQRGGMLLGGSGSCMEKHRGKPECNSALLASPKKSNIFLVCLHFLHTCPDSPMPPFYTPKGMVLQLISQHSFLQPPSLPLQLHQPVPVKPRNAPHNTCRCSECSLRCLAGPYMQHLPCTSPWWMILAIKLTGVNERARPGQGKAEQLLDLIAN